MKYGLICNTDSLGTMIADTTQIEQCFFRKIVCIVRMN